MKIDEIRIYAEVLEQGIDFKEYLRQAGYTGKVKNIYTRKSREGITDKDSLTDRIRKCKDVDVLITSVSENREFPLLMIEYSTAVPTDDHKMQRSDVYYWSSVFRVPMMKIYPSDKGMDQAFGGGDKFNDEIESVLAYRMGALFYPIQWKRINGLDTLETKKNALSCIYYEEKITKIIEEIITSFTSKTSFDDYYQQLISSYLTKNKLMIEKYKDNNLKSIIVDSTRFKWEGLKLISKINRFGHAMDPDRGILYFTNMLVGASNCITEIQINRPSNFEARGGYKSLFDATPREDALVRYVKEIIRTKNNVFDDKDALYIFSHALNIESFDLFVKVDDHKYKIQDNKLKSFFENCSSMTAKCIFFLSTKLILTDKNRATICQIEWNEAPIKQYLLTLNTTNNTPINIRELTINDAKEDIITFASVELYNKIKCDLLAVSYPGAQGDRCILTGDGRNVLRDYIDIIAYKVDDTKVTVFLEECKDNISKSPSDVIKLKEIVSSKEKMEGLTKLVKKTSGISRVDDTKISVGAKLVNNVPKLDVDYIFMFDINNDTKGKSIIEYTVAIIDLNLATTFRPLLNNTGKLRGDLVFDKLFIIE